MMRNRKLNRGLVPVVILVWGLIAYRFWYESEAHEPLETIINSQSLDSGFAQFVVDSFELSLPYRDPFLGELGGEKKRSPKEQNAKSPPKGQNPIEMPKIVYQGSIKAKERLGLVSWDGKNHRVQENEQLYHARIKQITAQYIELLIAGKIYRIARGKSIGEG